MQCKSEHTCCAISFNALGSPTAEVAPSYPVSYDAHGASNGKGLLNTGRPGVIKETVFSSEVHSIEYTDPKLQQRQSDPAISAQTNHLTQDSTGVFEDMGVGEGENSKPPPPPSAASVSSRSGH